MNPFEAGERKNIPAVLVYARFDHRILMIHRDSLERMKVDYHAGKWNGLGGKSELDESAWQTASREFSEEAGVRIPEGRFQALGALQFPQFKADKSEDWTVFVFSLDLTEDEAASIEFQSGEGSLHWIPERDLLELNLWPGDRHFLPFVLERKPFQGTLWYRGQELMRQDVRSL